MGSSDEEEQSDSDASRAWTGENIRGTRIRFRYLFHAQLFDQGAVEDLDLYVFEKKGPEWKITDKTWENVRDQLVYSRVNGGFPYIVVVDGDFNRIGELYLYAPI